MSGLSSQCRYVLLIEVVEVVNSKEHRDGYGNILPNIEPQDLLPESQ